MSVSLLPLLRRRPGDLYPEESLRLWVRARQQATSTVKQNKTCHLYLRICSWQAAILFMNL